MEAVHDDRFVVFLRVDSNHAEMPPDVCEQPLASCATYQEARHIRQLFNSSSSTCDCVIRYVGQAGGGD